jgi:hypothetical protein
MREERKINDTIDHEGKMRGAFSMNHSTERALPAMSLNSAPGSRERISVAEVQLV